MAFTTLSAWVIGQQLKAVTINLMTTAIQELQAAANAVGMLPNSMEVGTATALSVANATWMLCPVATPALYTSGSGMTAVTNGVTVAATGRYMVTAAIIFAGNATGRRIVGMSAGAGPPAAQNSQGTLGSASGNSVVITKEISFTAGDTVALFAYQDSTAALNVTQRNLTVRQVG